MPKIKYIDKRFSTDTQKVIVDANAIITTYMNQGYRLTLRQLYYRFVATGLLANTVQNYKRLGNIINDARLAGLVDWNAIEDRTRNLSSLPFWASPSDIVDACASQFKIDMWANQDYRVEVWIEKEALAGVFQRACELDRVPFFCCRGYTSQSEMWGAAQRLIDYKKLGQTPIILHFGDHDPSGIDMTRDIIERMSMFGLNLKVNRLALNMDQINQYNPPPNPAKDVDPRFQAYLQTYGDESWELDALEPDVLAEIVRNAIVDLKNMDTWETDSEAEDEHRRLLKQTSDRWDDVTDFLNLKEDTENH